ncbi:MAG: hypothetical protein V3S09_05930, partial [Candidatus Bathyarchaeia archaeon]
MSNRVIPIAIIGVVVIGAGLGYIFFLKPNQPEPPLVNDEPPNGDTEIVFTLTTGDEVTLRGAIRGGLTMVLGIFTVLGAAGLAASLASQWLQSVVPYLTLVAGGIMILLGLSKVLEDRIGALDFGSSLGGMIKPKGFFTLGVVYAFTAAGCTFPI